MEKIKLTNKQEKIFQECLNAVISGPFIPDWEFHILFGLYKTEVDAILQKWPNVNHKDKTVNIAINNSLANLCGYPISEEERWYEFISISREELSAMHEEWRKNIDFAKLDNKE